MLLNGKLLTGRDAAHKRFVDMLDQQIPLPIDLTNRFIYYVGPVDPIHGEIVDPAGPTTSSRMVKFVRRLPEAGLLGMVGKSERGKTAIDAICDYGAIYLVAVGGGAAYLVSKTIKAARVVAFDDLKMKAIYEFDVVDMPVTVAMDVQGRAIHDTGTALWRQMNVTSL